MLINVDIKTWFDCVDHLAHNDSEDWAYYNAHKIEIKRLAMLGAFQLIHEKPTPVQVKTALEMMTNRKTTVTE